MEIANFAIGVTSVAGIALGPDSVRQTITEGASTHLSALTLSPYLGVSSIEE